MINNEIAVIMQAIEQIIPIALLYSMKNQTKQIIIIQKENRYRIERVIRNIKDFGLLFIINGLCIRFNI